MSPINQIGTSNPNALEVAINESINLKAVALAAGQGTLTRGTVLGKSPADKKYYMVDSAAEPVVKRSLQITGDTTKTAVLALAGLTASSLKVYVGDEFGALAIAGADKDYTAAYEDDTLTITVIADGALDGAAQCYIEINKAAAGANIADCILAEDVNTGTSTDVTTTAYSSGIFYRNALIVADGDNISNHEDTLRSKGIFLKSAIY